MYACTLDMLHDAGDKEVLAVADSVDLYLGAHHVLVYEDGVLDVVAHDDAHVLLYVSVGVSDYHVLTAENIRRTEQHGIAKIIGSHKSLLCVHDCVSRRSGDTAFFKYLVEALSVLCGIYHIRGCTEDTDSHIGEISCKLDSGLTAELYHNAVGLLGLDDGLNVLFCEGVEVQTVACIKVGGNGLGVVVADNSLVAQLLQRPYAVYGAVVELDALPDTDRTASENDDLLLSLVGALDELLCLILLVEGGVEVGSLSLELACTGIYHLVDSALVLGTLLSRNALDGAVKVAVLLCDVVLLLGELALSQPFLQLHKIKELVEEPVVYHGYLVYLLGSYSALERLEYAE